jgi:hypothetical protein
MLLVTIIYCFPVRNKTIFLVHVKHACLYVVRTMRLIAALVRKSALCKLVFLLNVCIRLCLQKKVVRMQQIKAMFVFPSKRKGGRKYWVFFNMFN